MAKMFANSIGTKKDANPKMPTSKWNPKRQWTPKIFERKAEEFEKQNTLEYTKFKAEVEILLGNETKVPEVNAANVANEEQKEANLNQNIEQSELSEYHMYKRLDRKKYETTRKRFAKQAADETEPQAALPFGIHHSGVDAKSHHNIVCACQVLFVKRVVFGMDESCIIL